MHTQDHGDGIATRGESVRLRTLVDRKWKHYHNAVDVVVRLHDPTDPSTERTGPPSLAHVQLDDDLRPSDPAKAPEMSSVSTTAW